MEFVIQDFTQWRNYSRALLLEGIAPEQVSFTIPHGSGDLFGSPCDPLSLIRAIKPSGALKKVNGKPLGISREFMRQAHWVGHHSSAQRWQLLYSLAWRQIYQDKKLLQNPVDEQVALFYRLFKAVSRDHHKMKAFVRFQSISEFSGEDKVYQAAEILEPEQLHVDGARQKYGGRSNRLESCKTMAADESEHFVAWFEPDHAILPLVAPFFVKRFSSMSWSILTPHECVHWHQEQLVFTEGAARPPLPEDKTEQLWLQYYASIFNPARVKVNAMQSEMAKKYWKNLPEAQLIQTLLQRASSRVDAMYSLGHADKEK